MKAGWVVLVALAACAALVMIMPRSEGYGSPAPEISRIPGSSYTPVTPTPILSSDPHSGPPEHTTYPGPPEMSGIPGHSYTPVTPTPTLSSNPHSGRPVYFVELKTKKKRLWALRIAVPWTLGGILTKVTSSVLDVLRSSNQASFPESYDPRTLATLFASATHLGQIGKFNTLPPQTQANVATVMRRLQKRGYVVNVGFTPSTTRAPLAFSTNGSITVDA